MPAPEAGKRRCFMAEDAYGQRVVVADVRIPFFSMVSLMVKWAIAAIPAVFILVLMTQLFWALVNWLTVAFTGR
jgi:hypothetical protein